MLVTQSQVNDIDPLPVAAARDVTRAPVAEALRVT